MSIDNCIIKNKEDKLYRERNRLVALCGVLAKKQNYNAGIKKHSGDDYKKDRGTVFYIDLPTGQISYHIKNCEKNLFRFFKKYNKEFDGHDFEEKYDRIMEFIENENDKVLSD
ncbi:MAG: hypothetical protein ACQESP_02055 [Candidatus Muiribacteriota bacterium]